jgi:hypothetical protein
MGLRVPKVLAQITGACILPSLFLCAGFKNASCVACATVGDFIEILGKYRLHLSRLTSAAVLQRLIKINSDLKLVFSVTFIA